MVQPHPPWLGAPADPSLVSLVIPTFNRARWVAEAVQSVIEQTYRPIECLVVDDGSTDDTAAVLDRLRDTIRESDGFEIRPLRQPNAGACVARSRGLLDSRGAFVGFLDSDDLLLPHAVAARMSRLRASEAPYAYDLGERRDAQGQVAGRFGMPWPNPGQRVVTEYLFHTNAPLIRREVCDRVGPWKAGLRGGQEIEYFARLRILAGRGEFVNQVGHVVREHAGERIKANPRHQTVLLNTYELLHAHLEGSGPEWAADRAEIVLRLRTEALTASREAAREGRHRESLDLLELAHRYGYRSPHVRLTLGLARIFAPDLLMPLFHAARRLAGG